MTHRQKGRARAVRRLVTGTVIGAGALIALNRPAGAATTASFSNGVLTVTGDDADNQITISRNAAGTILVNGGAVSVTGDTPTIGNTELIQVLGQGGNDTLTLDETAGALPRANLFGGTEDDVLTGGSGNDQLFGQAGHDHLLGMGGNDFLFGGTEGDRLFGGDANDQVFGESGDDIAFWNPGDDTDLNEGGAGIDATVVIGGDGDEVFTTTANGTRVRFDRLDPAPFSIDIGTSEAIFLVAGGGNDQFSATGNLAALIGIVVNGGAGDDTILGGNGGDILVGGPGNDLVDGQQGNDVIHLEAGDDTVQWDPGDGSDQIEGKAGQDVLRFNGSAGSEIFTASADGDKLRFTRNLGNVDLRVGGVETVDLNALGGADTVVVNDLTGTGVATIDVDNAGTIGGSTGDSQTDAVVVNATSGDDVVDVFGGGTSASVVGLPTQVNLTNVEGANDSLVVNALAGDDGITATTVPAGLIKLTIDGGADDDTMLGSQGADVLLGGDGEDFAFGDNGNDLALLGNDDDEFQWDPGDGNDTVEGQSGDDTVRFFGSALDENVDVSANGGRVAFFRDVASVSLDLDGVERLDLRVLGGGDNVVIGDLSGTDLVDTDVDLRGPGGSGDGAPDSITVNGTQGVDVFGAAGDAGGVDVFGLHTAVGIFSPEQGLDRLTLNGLGGDDVIDATSLEDDGTLLTINGGLGDDVMIGGDGDDLFNGGDGDDLALMNNGDDTFTWNPGDDNDTLEGQAGFDRMVFNGSNVAENIDISANGGRVRFFRNVANVVMDLDDTEAIDFNGLGGADVVVVGDLTGTDVVEVNVNLAGSTGVGDASPDNVIVQGTSGDDVILAAGDAAGTSVFGLHPQVHITGAEASNDRLTINALAGDDVVDGTGLAAGAIQLTADGGADDDVLLGGDGNDVLIGGAGDDVLIGGLGLDTLDGSGGDNVVIQLLPDDDIIIQGLAAAPDTDSVVSAVVADAAWIVEHVRVVDGKTIVTVAGKERVLPQADLTPYLEQAIAVLEEPAEAAAPAEEPTDAEETEQTEEEATEEA